MKPTDFETALWGFSWREALSEDAQQGIANLTSEEGVKLEIPFGSLEGGDAQHGAIQIITSETKHYPALFGIARTGDYLMLKDVQTNGSSCSFPGGEKETLRASWLLSSRSEFDVAEPVKEIKLRLRGLRDWATARPITETMRLEESRYLDEYNIEYKRAEAPTEVLLQRESAQIELGHTITIPKHVSGRYMIEHDRELVVKLNEHISFEEALRDYAFSLSDFFSFCIGKEASIELLDVKFEKSKNWVSCFGQLVYDDLSPLKEEEIQRILLSQKILGDQLEGMLNKWLNLDEDLRLSVNYLIPLMTSKQHLPLDLTFAAAAMALDALSRYGRQVKRMNDDSFSEVVSYVKAALKDYDQAEWILNILRSQNRRSQYKLIGELYDDLGEFSSHFLPDRRRFIDVHCSLRNNQMHHNPKDSKLPQGGDLLYHTWAVIFFCYAGILRSFGFLPAKINEVFSSSRYEWWLYDKARSMYSRK